jgi:AcrR family transcriptional regulator
MASLSQRSVQQASRREAVEARLLEATEALLAHGASYADLKVEQITARAGISRTAFYFYFRDKRELLMRLTEGVAERLYDAADAWWSGEGDAAVELGGALEQVISLYREHALLLRAVVEASAYDEPVAVFWRAVVGRFVEASRRRIEREQRAGEIGPLPAYEIAFALCWMTERACYQRIVSGDDLADPDFVRALGAAWTGTLYGRVEPAHEPETARAVATAEAGRATTNARYHRPSESRQKSTRV